MRAKDPSLKITEVAKMGGQAWSALTDEQKQPFINKHNEDVERYHTEKKQLNENGFFINAEGVKSTDMKLKKKRSLEKRGSNDSISKKKRSKSAESKTNRSRSAESKTSKNEKSKEGKKV